MTNPIYNQIKNMIELKHYDKAAILTRLDKYVISKLITQEEYENILKLFENND